MRNLPPKFSQIQKFLALVTLTATVSVSITDLFLNSPAGYSRELAQTPQRPKAQLPNSVKNAVINAAVKRTSQRSSEFRVVQFEPLETDSCLNLPQPKEVCHEIGIPAWEVTLQGKQQRLVYRSDRTGSQVRYHEAATLIGRSTLPPSVRNAVLREAATRTKLPVSQLQIQKNSPLITNGCLNLPRPGEACTELAMPAWEITVNAKQQSLIYRSDRTGNQIRFHELASSLANLPPAVSNAVLRSSSANSGVSISQLRIVKIQQIYTDGCLNLPRPNEACQKINMPAWEVTVEAKQDRLVYRTDFEGAQIRLHEAASKISTTLPPTVAKSVLQKASQQSGIPVSSLNIAYYKRQGWSYGCERSTFPYPCDPVAVSGWLVAVESRDQLWLFLTDQTGSSIRLSQGETYRGDGSLPKSLVNQVLQKAAQDLQVSVTGLKLIQSKEQFWPDSCLGLAGRNSSSSESTEVCASVITQGWQFAIENAEKIYFYRMDYEGLQIRSEAITTSRS